jgi:hypothetical protein
VSVLPFRVTERGQSWSPRTAGRTSEQWVHTWEEKETEQDVRMDRAPLCAVVGLSASTPMHLLPGDPRRAGIART